VIKSPSGSFECCIHLSASCTYLCLQFLYISAQIWCNGTVWQVWHNCNSEKCMCPFITILSETWRTL